MIAINGASNLAFQPATEPIARIAGAALTGGGAFRFLRTLTHGIGARLTGSEGSHRAAELLVTTLTEAGLDRVHMEDYVLPSSWRRGTATARVVVPVERPLAIQAFGWTASTAGDIQAPVVDLGTARPSDFPALAGRVKGRIVLADFAEAGGEPAHINRARTAVLLARAGALAVLIPSAKPDGLLDVNCFGNVPTATLPMISIAAEDAVFLRRLPAESPVTVALRLDNVLDMTPSTERNVIAEWRGSAIPEEIVIVGAHFDSWDTACGADDNGSGVAAVVETARLLSSLALRPRRTIRFAFFSGEEQAILGSHAYVRAHRAELDRIKAVLIMDEGAGAPRGFRLHGRTDIHGAVSRLLAPLAPLQATEVSQEASFDQDHAFFLAAGIPVMTLWVHPGDYEVRHHSVADTLDKIDPRLLAIDTAVMAIAAYAVADGEPLGPRLSAAESADLLQRTGLQSTFELLGGNDFDDRLGRYESCRLTSG
jgi:Iap family predicted aminopeptidase